MDASRLVEALLMPFVDPASRTHWLGLLVAVCIALVVHGRLGGPGGGGLWAALRHRSTGLDIQLLIGRQLLRALGILPTLGGWWLATSLVRWLDASVGAPSLGWSTQAVTVTYTVALFVSWDLSRYLLHRVMHDVPVLWAFHQVHHSAEVLTPLTFHRVHPVESLLYGLRGMVVTAGVAGAFFWLFRGQATEWTILGVHGVGFLMNTVTGNLRHSHVWLRFGAWERWLVSPAQHQLHHSPEGDRRNFGTWLALWDRVFGTWSAAGPVPPRRFGIEHRNHGDDLVSAWLGPFHALARPMALGALLWGASAQAQDEAADESDDAETLDDWGAGYEIIVDSGPLPRVVGSAYQIGQEQLEQYEYDDIHSVLGHAPGVYVRVEDGYGLRPNIGIRGGNADRSAKITLLEDGVLFAPAPYAAPAAYYFPMVTRMVGVEVFKGPASIQHGPHTIGGALNLQTRPIPEVWMRIAVRN